MRSYGRIWQQTGQRASPEPKPGAKACCPVWPSRRAGHRSIKPQQVDCKYGCQDFHWRTAAPSRDYLNAAWKFLRPSVRLRRGSSA